MSLKNEKAKRETCRKSIFLQENIKLHILLIKIKNNEKNPIFSQIKNLKIKNTIQVRNFLHLFRWKNPNFLTKTWVLIFSIFLKYFIFSNYFFISRATKSALGAFRAHWSSTWVWGEQRKAIPGDTVQINGVLVPRAKGCLVGHHWGQRFARILILLCDLDFYGIF